MLVYGGECEAENEVSGRGFVDIGDILGPPGPTEERKKEKQVENKPC